MKLTAENVENVLKYCLFNSGEDTANYKLGEGARLRIGCHPGRIDEKKDEIKSMCSELPERFADGFYFLNACVTRNGEQWGEHEDVDRLLAIGTAAGCLEIMMPRELWQALPGGLPYFKVVAS